MRLDMSLTLLTNTRSVVTALASMAREAAPLKMITAAAALDITLIVLCTANPRKFAAAQRDTWAGAKRLERNNSGLIYGLEPMPVCCVIS